MRSALVPALLLLSTVAAAGDVSFRWDKLPPLPPAPGESRQPGVAGAFIGVHNGVLIVGGGANFPGEPPWRGGAKAWRDEVFVMERTADGVFRWAGKVFRLPRAMGYGASFDTPEGVVCAGGCDGERAYSEVFLLSWDAEARELRRTSLPPLPEPLCMMAGAQAGGALYLAGGFRSVANAKPTRTFWALDWTKRGTPAFRWDKLPPWPGPERILPVSAGVDGRIFLFGGRAQEAGVPTKILTDAQVFDPATLSWRTLRNVNGWLRGGGDGWGVMGGTAVVLGGEVFFFGGSRGTFFMELEDLDFEIAALKARMGAADAGERARLQGSLDACLARKVEIQETHPGFAREILAYDTARDTWRVAGSLPFGSAVTTRAFWWGGAVVIPSGEISPGVRTDQVWRGVVSVEKTEGAGE
ncbi:MAG: hypothetical protein LBR12_00530 [Opitutaceae bacterium]|jgi:N-acetylneuraminic acid mutarotase|nr:hypothetical protein [Opitutaceae bacterium]